MNTIIILYLLFCIPLRILIYTNFKNTKNLKFSGILAIAFGLGFLYQYIYKRKKGILGQEVWWDNNRIIYGILYLIYAFFLLVQEKNYHFILLFSIIYGLNSFINKHYIKKN
tara:strand:- start:1315 stop:1650 length:336 start_codon:yes stop_codon:yes gene_type:complete